jgi:hypothetical protein
MINNLSNRAFGWLCATLIGSIVALSLVIAHMQDIVAAWLWIRWVLALIAAILALFALYLLWHQVSTRHLSRKQQKTEVKLLQASYEDEKWRADQTLLHAQEMERERLEIERERVHLEQMKARLEHERLFTIAAWQAQQITVPATHGLYVREETGYQMLQAPHVPQVAGPKSAGMTNVSEAPTQQFLISQLPQNGLIVSPGVRRSIGDIVKVNICEIPHLKIIGSSGFGKSCLAGALLDQATTLNTPDLLQIALLDLEHKTSRLFENLPHVASVRIGQRLLSLVATDPDEVALHFGYLKKELDRRARLPEDDLDREPVLLIYVEEMLSLQYEVDPKMLDQMLAHLAVLAVRGRKYRMFFLCCAQTDYSTEELRTAQKMFRFRAAGGIDVTAARAAGFMNTQLIKENFQTCEPGQGLFVVEFPAFSDIVLAPRYDWKTQLQAQKSPVRETFTGPLVLPVSSTVNTGRTPSEHGENTLSEQAEHAWQARLEAVRGLYVRNWGKIAIIEKIWGAKRGDSKIYRQAEAEYHAMIAEIEGKGE